MNERESLSIWFFVGVTLAGNGFLIVLAGLYALISPPETRVVLYNLHADLWWGSALLIIGLFYLWRFTPRRAKS